MSDENLPSDEDMIELLKDVNGELRGDGWTITPKGYIALTLMTQQDMSLEEAERLSQKIEDAVFLGGYNYVRADGVFQVPGDARDL